MIRFLVAILFLVPTSAVVAFDCPFGTHDALTPVRWTAEQDAAGGITVRLGVRNPEDKVVKMVDAAVWFVDPLGRIVGDQGLELDPDLAIAANGANIDFISTSAAFGRLVGAKLEDFTPTICTRALLFEDGSKSEY